MTKKDQFKEQDIIKSIEPKTLEKKDLTIVRTFNAPKTLLYKAFIDPSYIERWWGTYYCQKSVCQMDPQEPQVGGKITIIMTLVGGKEVTVSGEFYELVENEKIVFSTGTLKNNSSDFDVEQLNTVVLEEIDGKTKLTLHVEIVQAREDRVVFAFKGMVKAWPESLDRLEKCLQTDIFGS